MSQWGTIDATFKASDGGMLSADTIRHELERREVLAPTGSEDGPAVHEGEPGTIWVEGRLRDVTDTETSPMVLAWFMHHAQWCEEAELLWDLDRGPRYRYEWKNGELTRLRGVLDR